MPTPTTPREPQTPGSVVTAGGRHHLRVIRDIPLTGPYCWMDSRPGIPTYRRWDEVLDLGDVHILHGAPTHPDPQVTPGQPPATDGPTYALARLQRGRVYIAPLGTDPDDPEAPWTCIGTGVTPVGGA